MGLGSGRGIKNLRPHPVRKEPTAQSGSRHINKGLWSSVGGGILDRGPEKGGTRLLVKARSMGSPGGLPGEGDTTWAWLDKQEFVQERQKRLGGQRREALQVEST